MKKKTIANYLKSNVTLIYFILTTLILNLQFEAHGNNSSNERSKVDKTRQKNDFHINIEAKKQFNDWFTVLEKHADGKIRYHALTRAKPQQYFSKKEEDSESKERHKISYFMLSYVNSGDFTISYYPKNLLLQQKVDNKAADVILQINAKSYRLKTQRNHAETYTKASDIKILNDLLKSKSDFTIYSKDADNQVAMDNFSVNGMLEAMQSIRIINHKDC
jgi:hypothetical protein